MSVTRAMVLGSLVLLSACDPGVVDTGGLATDPGNPDPLADSDAGVTGTDGAAHRPGADLSLGAQGGGDMAPIIINQTAIGPKGGAVNLLHFGITGDTRPPNCDDTASYPTDVITSIATALQNRGAQFGLDLGDHMYVCNDSLQMATDQMNLYMQGTSHFTNGTWFMTQGNHECYKGPCYLGSTQSNHVAYMNALAPIANAPWYSFDIQTSRGLATFVVIADMSWDQQQATWLDQTLAVADQKATYTIIARHHPEGDSTVYTNPESMAIIRNHKFALFLSGHSHLYKHMTTDGARDLVLGAGGAPLIAGGSFYGYAMIDQLQNGQLQVTVFDLNNPNAPLDTWAVNPN